MCHAENISKILYYYDIGAKIEGNAFLSSSFAHPREQELCQTLRYLPVHRHFQKQAKPCDCFQHFILLLICLCDPGKSASVLCTAVMTLRDRDGSC